MAKTSRNKDIFMKEIKSIYKEMQKKSTGCFKDGEGDIFYLLNGKYHRLDGPAIEYPAGGKYWYLHGKYHRSDGPAIERSNGDKCWYLYGKVHRLDGPAIELSTGTKWWYLHGEEAESEKQFWDPNWRKRLEIERFL